MLFCYTVILAPKVIPTLRLWDRGSAPADPQIPQGLAFWVFPPLHVKQGKSSFLPQPRVKSKQGTIGKVSGNSWRTVLYFVFGDRRAEALLSEGTKMMTSPWAKKKYSFFIKNL